MAQTQLASIYAPGQAVAEDNFCLLQYGPALVDELMALLAKKKRFETLFIDGRESGFLFPLGTFLEIASLGSQILTVQGNLVLLKTDKVITLRRESVVGYLSLNIFANYDELFHYSPSLFQYIQRIFGQAETLLLENTDLAQQILFSCIPVLTDEGIKSKANKKKPTKGSILLSIIDNYTPLSAISMRLAQNNKMTVEEMFTELKELEATKAIYPLFPKISFLAECFRNRLDFTPKEYFLAANLITQSQLDELMVGAKVKIGLHQKQLGPLLLKMGYINARQLEIAMQEMAFYGQKGTEVESRSIKGSAQEGQMQTMVGYLGNTDPANLLQNFVQNRNTGILSVEYRDYHFRAQFEEGRLTHAKVGKIPGNKAILEFVSSWKEGIFVFIERQPLPDLSSDACRVTKNLDKLLLEAALAVDNMVVDKKVLPDGLYTTLEKLPDPSGLLGEKSRSSVLKDPKENIFLEGHDILLMNKLWKELDGLTKLDEAIKKLSDVAIFEGVRAANLLMQNNLAHLPDTDLFKALEKFNLVCSQITAKVGLERSLAFLRLSMRDSLGYSLRARMFIVGRNGDVGIDQSAAHHAHASLSEVLQDLEDWQVKYVEYVSTEMDPTELMSIIQTIHN